MSKIKIVDLLSGIQTDIKTETLQFEEIPDEDLKTVTGGRGIFNPDYVITDPGEIERFLQALSEQQKRQ
ncbi:hypothetical protein WA1_16725 [Scytonema hofmannii PCC 7110]|uniref:Uncharacterized protein n=1 Tax=Scytonema hofmannii PCC 7110 TaxID=128403 RepID=A0A139XAF4_9CYAN|nr:bacteriocin [Scytonema hofmannii]KYC41684.1 hypothetical protein WA1_16725 [Scytonema hofmannii PCC 7110]